MTTCWLLCININASSLLASVIVLLVFFIHSCRHSFWCLNRIGCTCIFSTMWEYAVWFRGLSMLMLYRTAGDAVGYRSTGKEEDHGTVFLRFLYVYYSTLWLCWEVKEQLAIISLLNTLRISNAVYLLILIYPLQSLHDSVDIHRQSIYCRRVSGSLCVHSRGKISTQCAVLLLLCKTHLHGRIRKREASYVFLKLCRYTQQRPEL